MKARREIWRREWVSMIELQVNVKASRTYPPFHKLPSSYLFFPSPPPLLLRHNHTTADDSHELTIEMADKLPKLVQSLPQELYDHVLALTFTISGGSIPITKALRPPSTFQVDRNTRLQVAQGYYGTSTFLCTDREVLVAWLAALAVPHRGLMRSITLRIPNPFSMLTSLTDAEIAQAPQMQQGVRELAQKGFHIDEDSHQNFCGWMQGVFCENLGGNLARRELEEFREDLEQAEHWADGDTLGWLTVEIEGLGQYVPEYVGEGPCVARQWRLF